MTIIVDPDQTAPVEQSDLGLHCCSDQLFKYLDTVWYFVGVHSVCTL